MNEKNEPPIINADIKFYNDNTDVVVEKVIMGSQPLIMIRPTVNEESGEITLLVDASRMSEFSDIEDILLLLLSVVDEGKWVDSSESKTVEEQVFVGKYSKPVRTDYFLQPDEDNKGNI